jgi:uncharacterized protein
MQEVQRVAIVGVTGFIGHSLPRLLSENGYATTGVSRAGKGEVPGVDRWQKPDALDLAGHQAVINLAGEPIDKRWTEENRRRFHESRIGTTQRIVENIAKLPEAARPKVLVNGSAVGIYGDRQDELLSDTARRGSGYLAELCSDWEDAARDAESLGVRVVRLRTGIVLGKNGPAFEKLHSIFKLGIGGKLGSGRQWMPWIHVADLRAAIVHAVLSERLSGPINGAAPTPERNADFTRKLASAMHRPAILPTPAWMLKLAVGEFSSALLASQRAVPNALQADGFKFRFPSLESALTELLA